MQLTFIKKNSFYNQELRTNSSLRIIKIFTKNKFKKKQHKYLKFFLFSVAQWSLIL